LSQLRISLAGDRKIFSGAFLFGGIMPGKGCKKKGRKHTPVVSQAQTRLFGAKAGGKKTKAKSLSRKEAREHLKGLKIKSLPKKARKKKKK